MDMKLYQKEGFWATFSTAFLLIAIQLTTYYFKEFFVPETGNLKLFGGLGVILAIALIFKIKLVWYVINVLTFLCLLPVIFMVFWQGQDYLLARLVLLFALVSLIVLLLSKPVRTYVNAK